MTLILVFSQNSKILAQTYVWEGNSNEIWSDESNWLAGGIIASVPPTSSDDVIIGNFTSPGYWPEITATDVCRHLEFTNNGHIDFGSGGILTVRGDIVSKTNQRFYLHFYNTEKVLESQPVLSSGAFSVIKNGQLSIFVQEEPLERQTVSIHALNGELLYQQDLFLLQGEIRMPSLMLNKGCFLVNVSNSKENTT